MHKDTNACGAPLTCLTVSRYCGQEYMVMHKNNLLDDCGHLPEERWQQNVSLYSVIPNVSLYSVIPNVSLYSVIPNVSLYSVIQNVSLYSVIQNVSLYSVIQNVSLYSVIQNVSLYSVIIKGYVHSQLNSFPHPPE